MVKKAFVIVILCLLMTAPAWSQPARIDQIDKQIQFEYDSQDIFFKLINQAEARLETYEELIRQDRALIADLSLMVDRSFTQIEALDAEKGSLGGSE